MKLNIKKLVDITYRFMIPIYRHSGEISPASAGSEGINKHSLKMIINMQEKKDYAWNVGVIAGVI